MYQMKLKKHLFGSLLLVVMILFATDLSGQRMRDRVEAQRVAFMTQQMDLTPDESAAFWPLYKDYKEAMDVLREEIHFDRSRIRQMNDAEAEAWLDKIFENEEKQIDLKRQYIAKFKNVIPAKKILMIAPLERAFNREILKKLRE